MESPEIAHAPVEPRHRSTAIECFTGGRISVSDPRLVDWIELGEREKLPPEFVNVFPRITATAQALADAEALGRASA